MDELFLTPVVGFHIPFIYLLTYFGRTAACEDLSFLTGTKAMSPAVEVESLNHWTSR